MFWSKYFIPTLKEVPASTEAISHQMLLRSGLVNMLTAGVYSYLPLGLRVLNRIEDIIRQEMNKAGAHELFMPCLQPIDLWQKTGRDKVLEDVMFRFQDKKKREMCLGPTHEEIITELVHNYVQSYRQLPVTLYQIQTKFRDELRPRFGVIRACEFIMKDAYSFHRDLDDLNRVYALMHQAYLNIFRRCDLDIVVIAADSGAMGGSVSHEFLSAAAIGEDVVLQCQECGFAQSAMGDQPKNPACPKCHKGDLVKKSAIELGHIFQLGTKYSKALDALYLDEDGKQKSMIMGCYGIGVSRLIAAIIEGHNDSCGIIWPKAVSPFDVEVLPLQMNDSETVSLSKKFYDELVSSGQQVLLDDRDETPGRKFNDADLIGIPYRIVVGKRALKNGQVEIKCRRTGEELAVKKEEVVVRIQKLLSEG